MLSGVVIKGERKKGEHVKIRTDNMEGIGITRPERLKTKESEGKAREGMRKQVNRE